jgi:hypothetical protein
VDDIPKSATTRDMKVIGRISGAVACSSRLVSSPSSSSMPQLRPGLRHIRCLSRIRGLVLFGEMVE